jgi:DNA processing protein
VSSTDRLPDAAAAAAVASLPAMTPQRLLKLGRAGGELAEADWRSLLDALRAAGPAAEELARLALDESTPAPGQARRLAERWSIAARASHLPELARRHAEAGVRVLVHGVPGYPAALLADPDPPAVVFCRGAVADPGPGAVAVVGTRSCTHYGQQVARELGAGLSAQGVSVVSGLAAGIDAAAHEGALAPQSLAAGGAVPAAVLGSGIDVVYPHSTARIRRRLEEAGTLLSEAPLGAPPEPWRFPLRNRIIAALSQVVVVVESHLAGGALHTVEAALARGVEVMAVPGSVHSPASGGTNALLGAGAQLVTCVDDVLMALSRRGVPAGRRDLGAAERAGSGGVTARLSPLQRAVLAAVEQTPTATEEILERTGAGLGAVCLALEELATAGAVADCGGAWVRLASRRGERSDRPSR